MTLRLLAQIARDQWRVLVFGIVLALSLSAGMVASSPRQYEVATLLVVSAPALLPPPPDQPFAGAQITNPLVRNDGSLSDVARLLAAGALSQASSGDLQPVVKLGREETFMPVSSPFIRIATVGSETPQLRRAVATEVEELRADLYRVQSEAGVRRETLMTLEEVSPIETVRIGLLTSSRPALVVALGGLALTALVVFMRTDGARLHTVGSRRRRPKPTRSTVRDGAAAGGTVGRLADEANEAVLGRDGERFEARGPDR